MKGIGAIVREILRRSRGRISPAEILTLRRTDCYGVQDRIALLYDPSGLMDGYTIWKNPLMVLQTFIRRRDKPIDNQWSNVDLSDLNDFLVGKVYCPLAGVIINQILTGVPRYHIIEASVRIQSTFRQFQACNRRN